MRERPILFSAPMVRAILDGAKTQTRRVVKGWQLQWLMPPINFSPEYVALPENDACPFGQPGDRLWVRETFLAFGRWETRFSPKKGRDEWHFVDLTLDAGRHYRHVADEGFLPTGRRRRAGAAPTWWVRPSIHMPRWASRITLEVTGVRVERLQDISEADAQAEGIVSTHGGYGLPDGSHFHALDPRVSYWSLWNAINGPGSVQSNPWVWVVEFRRMPCP